MAGAWLCFTNAVKLFYLGKQKLQSAVKSFPFPPGLSKGHLLEHLSYTKSSKFLCHSWYILPVSAGALLCISSCSWTCLGSELVACSGAGWEGQVCSLVSRLLPCSSLCFSVFVICCNKHFPKLLSSRHIKTQKRANVSQYHNSHGPQSRDQEHQCLLQGCGAACPNPPLARRTTQLHPLLNLATLIDGKTVLVDFFFFS